MVWAFVRRIDDRHELDRIVATLLRAAGKKEEKEAEEDKENEDEVKEVKECKEWKEEVAEA